VQGVSIAAKWLQYADGRRSDEMRLHVNHRQSPNASRKLDSDKSKRYAAMSNDFDAIKLYFENDRFAAANGMRLLEVRRGFAKTCLKVDDRHINCLGIVQGGAVFTLADFAFGAASNSGGKVAVAVNTNISFLKATRSGTLYAEAAEISRSRKLSVHTVQITNDAGELVALFQGTAYIKDEPFPPE
jgi:acyl-CoA thioesterase